MNHQSFGYGKEGSGLMKNGLVKCGVSAAAMFLLCLLPMAGVGAPLQNTHLILLDAAHGGEDSGVVSDKIREKDLTMNIALMVRLEAQKIPGLQVRMTRSADRGMTISERVKAARAEKTDCVLSLHVNAGFGKQASGYEIYFPGFSQTVPGGKDALPIIKDMARNRSLNDSVRLAQSIQSGLEAVFPRKGRGLRDAPSPLLEDLSIPGLVVEIGFATQTDDRKKLTDAETQRAVARALVKGIHDYFQKGPS
jgi:N-acetylmuramoyl-L-alanine amidase